MIKAGEMRATAQQPAAVIAEMAVEQADRFTRTGSTGRPEKQSTDCELVTADNHGRVRRLPQAVSGPDIVICPGSPRTDRPLDAVIRAMRSAAPLS